jgi:hypothetical protein
LKYLKTPFSMKKILIAVSLMLLVSAGITNAQVVSKKTTTEAKMDCAKCPHAKGCAMMADAKTSGTVMSVDSTKCKGKCDMAKCKSMTEGTAVQKKDCDPSKCKMMTKK